MNSGYGHQYTTPAASTQHQQTGIQAVSQWAEAVSQPVRSVGAAKYISISSGCLSKQDNFISEKRNDQTILLNFSILYIDFFLFILFAEMTDQQKSEINGKMKYEKH